MSLLATPLPPSSATPARATAPGAGWLRTAGCHGLVALVHGGLIWLLVAGLAAAPRRAEPVLTVQWLSEDSAGPTATSPARMPPHQSQPQPGQPGPQVAPWARPAGASESIAPAAAEPAAPVVRSQASEAASAAIQPLAGALDATPPATTPPRFDADYLHNPQPDYPRLARRLGEQGSVLLRVEVGPEGRPLQVAVEQASGSLRLDAAAVEAVRLWRFTPARLGERAIAGWVQVPIHFRLDN